MRLPLQPNREGRRVLEPGAPPWRAIRAFAVALLATMAVVGSGPPTGAVATMVASQDRTDFRDAASVTVSAARHASPTRLRIPAIAVDARLMELGLRKDRSLEVPPDAATSGWFNGGPRPGQMGPAIIAAHVHWNGRPGVFAHLGALRYDDRIIVARSDGSSAVFRVTRVSRFAKSRFPTNLVYGNIDHAGLRLITCDGFDYSHHRYLDNVVVFAMLITIRPAADRPIRRVSLIGR
jgi:sortase (surface protein transpeptidase)